MNMEYIIF